MKLTKGQIKEMMKKNSAAWDNLNLEGVLEIYHNDVYFENWTGGHAEGKEALKKAWTPWFNSGNKFIFHRDDIFIDEEEQKFTVTWELEWTSTEKGYEGKPEKRRGLDVYHLKDGKVYKKFTYSKTTIAIDGKRIQLKAETPS